MRYPVSEEKCSGCNCCCLVTHSITGVPFKEEERYYQCLGMAEDVCGEGMEEQ